MKLVFSDGAWDDYLYWIDADPKILGKLNQLIDECRRTPFKGKGKPEPLKGDLAGWWSRRLTSEDRLIYRVAGRAPEQSLEIAQCRFHY
ncbi:MAG: Txe/YoeB family addiction module toxin [Sphingomonas sp.]|uniref:Txe/YoeB family addiction module toxin n=1 Tax=Sphingomonas sp. TaxID=28214 RepID=UPI0025FFC7E9|nr:Txe/YoeB family addiction module toxin [Sphingomonas sp.]MBX9881619.1 Txe/YoeB family addiction module toxin [Sphingomonas sp.]